MQSLAFLNGNGYCWYWCDWLYSLKNDETKRRREEKKMSKNVMLKFHKLPIKMNSNINICAKQRILLCCLRARLWLDIHQIHTILNISFNWPSSCAWFEGFFGPKMRSSFVDTITLTHTHTHTQYILGGEFSFFAGNILGTAIIDSIVCHIHGTFDENRQNLSKLKFTFFSTTYQFQLAPF